MKIIFVFVFAFLLVGCDVKEVRFDSLQNSVKSHAQDIIISSSNNHVNEFDDALKNKEDRIVLLEDTINNLVGIKNSSIVIFENAAIVSINVEEGIGNQMLTQLRRDIEKSIKENDNAIRYVSVTSTPEMIESLYKVTIDNTKKGIAGETITNLRPPI